MSKKDEIDLGKDLDDNWRQLKLDEENQQNKNFLKIKSKDNRFEKSEDKKKRKKTIIRIRFELYFHFLK